MRTIQTLLMWGALAGLSVLLPVLVVLWCKERQLFPGRRLLVAYRRLPWFGQFLILAFAAHLIVFGSTKTNATDGVSGGASASQRLGVRQPSEATQPKAARRELLVPTVSVDDIVRGYRLAEVTTNASISYEMPDDAILCGNWHLRGAYDDVTRIDFGDWRFPIGSNSCDHFWAFVSAALRPTIRDAQHALVATDETLSAIPRQSALWLSADSPLVRRITWEDFALGRVPISTTDDETNAVELVSAQIELHRNGDFITRANDVEKTYRRVNPFDWDGDGLPNDRDPNPYVYDGDHFGPEQVLPEGANTNAYCWIDVVVPHVDALVTFEGDGPSNLADPDFIARADETNRVTLLIGKTYEMRCDQPIEIVGQSDPAIQVWQTDESAFICWPVEISCVLNERRLLRSLGDDDPHPPVSFTMQVSPMWMGGNFEWSDFCCRISGAGYTYLLTCDAGCNCQGCTVSGRYEYEGYNIQTSAVSCGCSSDNHPGGDGDNDEPIAPEPFGVWFSKDTIIFEDAYRPEEGVRVARRSSRSTLTCAANGGAYGGTARFEVTGGGRLHLVSGFVLPIERHLRPDERFEAHIVYEGKPGSGAQPSVTATFRSDDPETPVTNATAQVQVVQIEILSVVDAPENLMSHRHKFGVREQVFWNVYPEDADVQWMVSDGHLEDVDIYRCPLVASDDPLTVYCGDASFTPKIRVVEPSGISTCNPQCVTYHVSAGRAGWVGLRQEYYVEPFDVSFREIKMEEVPSLDGAHSGYFSDSTFQVIWYHTRGAGAGKWIEIDEMNKMGEFDTARITMELGRIDANGNFTNDPSCGWSCGWITSEIPFGWNTSALRQGDQVDPVKTFDPRANHRFEIDADGNVSVRKFGNTATRLINATFKLNGVPCTPVGE